MSNESSTTGQGWLVRLVWIAGLILLAIQAVPYGRDHSNPPTTKEPVWDAPETRELFVRACGDCHSNRTVWPWYSQIAPFSWLVQHDVEEGRGEFDVSQYDRPDQEGHEAAAMIREGEMPPWFYLPLHAEARLSDEEREALVSGLVRTFGDSDHIHDVGH